MRTIDLSEEEGIKTVIGCPKGHLKNGRCEVGAEVQVDIYLHSQQTPHFCYSNIGQKKFY